MEAPDKIFAATGKWPAFLSVDYMFVDRHSQRIDLPAKGRMRTNIVDNLTHACQQPRVIQHRLADTYTVLTELAGFSD